MAMKKLVFVAFAFCAVSVFAEGKIEGGKPAVLPSEAHMDWLKRGIISIVHFGLNTYTDQEWGFGDVDPKLFNPTKLDARQWVAAAKAGGIRCLVLVAKHHDGFCLWPSKLNADYTVANSPWKGGKGDLVKEVRDACVEAGLDFGVYLSPWDRHQAEYARPAYVDYFHGQWDDIMANYGPIIEIWLDGANGGDGWYGGAKGKRTIPKDYYKLPWLQERLCRNYPRAVAFQGEGANCVRWCGNEAGFNAETCRHVVDGYWRPPEADTPLRGGWFWHPYEAPKSLKVLVDTYFWCVGRNAVLNLGLAPNREGLIGKDDVARLKEFGDYVRAYESSDVAKDAKLETSADGRIVTLRAKKPVKFNAIDLGENILRGQYVDAFAVEAKVGGVWKELAKATTIGYRRILRIHETEATAVRLTVTKATANPEICSFRLRVAPEVAETFVASGLDFISKSMLRMRTSEDLTHVWIRPNETLKVKLRGFAYKPNAESLDGVVDRWAVDGKMEGRGWERIAEGEFGNMRANPATQTVVFKQPVECLELRILALRAVEGKPRFLVQQLDVFK